MGIVEAIVGIVATAAIGSIGAGTVGLSVLGASMVAGVIYGGNAIVKGLSGKKESYSSSPTYQFNTLQTQTNNQLPIPIIYGENKIAGNRLWQQYRNNNTIIDRIIAFGEGEIDSISEIRLNDLAMSDLTGITYRTYTGQDEQIVDSIVPGDLNKRIKTVGALKKLAYIAISVKATEKIRSDYNLTAIVKGRKVRIYSSPEAYTVGYSNNPAWCLLDFLTCYNGCGIGLLENGQLDDAKITELIDIGSFIDAAAFCSELVDEKPRFCFNMIIDSQAQRQEIIEEFKKACRGALTLKGKQLQLKIDCPSEPVKTIRAKDIIPGTEQFFALSRDENYDRIAIKYRSKENEWAICEAIAEKPQYDNIPPVEHSINIYSVTEHDQASRLAWYYLNKVAHERYFGYFETDYRAFDLEIGDVIEFSDNLMNFDSKLVKITRMTDKNDGTFGVSWREFTPYVYSDQKGSIAPTVALLRLENDFVVPPLVEGFTVTQVLNMYSLSWISLDLSDVSYEIRVGDTWDTAKILGTNITSNSIYIPISSLGIKKFLIKAKSRYNFYSEHESATLVYINSYVNVNTILSQNLFNPYGACVNAKVYNEKLKPKSSGLWPVLMHKNPTTPFTTPEGKWGIISSNTDGAYVTDVYDIKTAVSNLVSLEQNFYSPQSATKLSIYIQTAGEGGVLGEWQNYADGSMDFRYYKLKFVFDSAENELWTIDKAILNVDVPDRDEFYRAIEVTNPQTGVTIDFSEHEQSKIKKPFFCIPSIVANITGTQIGYCVITEKSENSITVRTFSDNNTPITALVDIHVKGY